MKIISKFKDFYDFVVFETDNRKIYIRNTLNVVFKEEELNEKTFLSPISANDLYKKYKGDLYSESINNVKWYMCPLYFCDKIFMYLKYEDKIFWKNEDIPDDILKKTLKHLRKYFWLKKFHNIGWVKNKTGDEFIKTNINRLFNSPVVFVDSHRYEKIIINPKLSDMGLNKIFSPSEVYQDIYNWLPFNEPEIPSSPDDMDRYEGKGFDIKTSFRPNIKKK